MCGWSSRVLNRTHTGRPRGGPANGRPEICVPATMYADAEIARRLNE